MKLMRPELSHQAVCGTSQPSGVSQLFASKINNFETARVVHLSVNEDMFYDVFLFTKGVLIS